MKKLLAATLLLASTSVFATTTTFSGRDHWGVEDSETAKINISYTAGSFNLTGMLDPTLRFINDANSGLYGPLGLLSDSDSTFTYAPVLFDWTRYTFSASNLAAGSYTLQFNLFGGGRYTGSYTTSAVSTPVPEPETYGMMFVGLALMGTIAFRRQKN